MVTGKGGTGKTTVAAALALALASTGKNVLLCEVEGRQGIAQLFDVDPLPYEERRIAAAWPGRRAAPATSTRCHRPRGGAARVPRDVLPARPGRPGARPVRRHRLRHHDRARRARRAAHRQGLRGGHAATARKGAAPAYDAVVLDAPPTGRIGRFLNVNTEVAGLAKVGPIKNQADTVMTLFRSPRTAVHLVTVLEEMPVQETADGIAELREARLPVGGVIVNLVRPRDLGSEDLAAARRRRRWTATRIGDGAAARPGSTSTTSWSTACSPRPTTTPSAAALEDAQRELVAELGRADVRAAAAARRRRPRRACTSWPPLLKAEGWREPDDARMTTHRGPRRPARRHRRPRRPARHRRAARRPRHPDHRVLRLRRRRQDHHRRGAGAAGRRAGPQGRRAHHRPGPPAGPVDGHRRAGQHPAPGAGRRRPSGGSSTR